MLAPRLRHRVTIQMPQNTRDAHGGTVPGWTVFVDQVPAEVVPLSGREFVAAQAVQAGVTTRITLRDLPGLTAAMRVLHDGATYNIKAVLPDPTLRRHVSIMCEQGVNDG